MVEVQVFEGDGKLPPEFEALRKENAILKSAVNTLREEIAERDKKIEHQQELIDTLAKRLNDPKQERKPLIDDDDQWVSKRPGSPAEWVLGDDVDRETQQDRFTKARKMYNDWANEDALRAIKMSRAD